MERFVKWKVFLFFLAILLFINPLVSLGALNSDVDNTKSIESIELGHQGKRNYREKIHLELLDIINN